MPNRRFWGIVLILFAVGLGFTTYERVRSVHWYVLPEGDNEAERAARRSAEADTARLEAMRRPWPRENWRYCKSWPDRGPPFGESTFLQDIEQAYRNPAQRANSEARLVLYRTVLTVNADRVQSWRTNVAFGDSAFAAFIDEGIAFVERFCALADGEAMRQAAQDFPDGDDASGWLREAMLMTAGLFGSSAAQFESGMRALNENSTYYAWGFVDSAAANGYLPAQLYLAEAFLSGDRLRRNDLKAAYWYARARLSGAPADERFEALGKTLNRDQRSKINISLTIAAGELTVQQADVLSGRYL